MEILGSLRSEFVETPSAKEAVLFSNTASFLLERLQKDSASTYISQRLKTEEIVSLLEERSKTPPANPIDLLWIYLLLAALSLKPDLPAFKDRLTSIDLRSVQWGDEIRRSVMEAPTPSTFVAVEFEPLGKKSATGVPNTSVTGIVIADGTRR
jgi:hypothetical protein